MQKAHSFQNALRQLLLTSVLDSGCNAQSFDAVVQTRNFARHGVLMQNALAHARMISGCAAFRAAAAASWLPEAKASSTLRKKVRIRERRALFTSWRASDWRARFLDWAVFAISFSVSVWVYLI
jgi:hypothetical protein